MSTSTVSRYCGVLRALSAVRREERGRIMAVFTGAFSLGTWAGATLLGLVAERATAAIERELVLEAEDAC